jgi:ribosomal protein L19E
MHKALDPQHCRKRERERERKEGREGGRGRRRGEKGFRVPKVIQEFN